MKKILAIALACTVSAFAAWDYFPVQDAGKGEAKVGAFYLMHGDRSQLGLVTQARYSVSVIPNLEAAIFLNFPLAGWDDGESLDDVAGMNAPTIGLRYWLPMGLGVFADFDLPFHTYDGDIDADLTTGIQFSTAFSEALEFGSELRVLNLINDFDVDLGIGLEVDYSLGSITPFVGAEINNLLIDADVGVDLVLGSAFKISDAMSVDASVTLGVVNESDDMPIAICANFSLSF
ncbi:MAG: hypothetical protein LBU89_08910 [Fibromonadaceae bacterium]|jgi:hypothetical protein|nr:hypothetical protein [Fibromonadaceae bacterium]